MNHTSPPATNNASTPLTARQILCVRFPQWPLARQLRNQSSRAFRTPNAAAEASDSSSVDRSNRAPLFLCVVETETPQRRIIEASPDAMRCGVRVGMTLTEGRILSPQLQHLKHDPAADRRTLEAVGHWLMAFTPLVGIAENDESRHALFMDLTGCERLWGGIDELIATIATALKRARFNCVFGFAPTPGGAWARSLDKQFTQRNSVTTSASSSVGRLPSKRRQADGLAPAVTESRGPTSLNSLRLPVSTVLDLKHFGLHRLDQLAAIPREDLCDRFGPELLTRLDQAAGRVHESVQPLTFETPIAAAFQFEFPAYEAEDGLAND